MVTVMAWGTETREEHVGMLPDLGNVGNLRGGAQLSYTSGMDDLGAAKKRKKHKSSGYLRGAAVEAKNAPTHCKVELSDCMKGGGRKVAGMCMRRFQRCKRK